MARGWESKSVEAQIESAQADTRTSVARETEDVEVVRQRENLTLSRTRVLRELETSRNPRYRSLLEKALADLDAQLLRLPQGAARAAKA